MIEMQRGRPKGSVNKNCSIDLLNLELKKLQEKKDIINKRMKKIKDKIKNKRLSENFELMKNPKVNNLFTILAKEDFKNLDTTLNYVETL
jgi:hypothetical protein